MQEQQLDYLAALGLSAELSVVYNQLGYCRYVLLERKLAGSKWGVLTIVSTY